MYLFQATDNILAGGFGDADTNDPKVVRAAKVALDAFSAKHETLAVLGIALDKVTKAEAQSVAGTNYQLKFDARLKSNWLFKFSCHALVYQNFDYVLSVTSVDCKLV